MDTKILSARQLRERKFLFRAPLIALPLFTGLFWVMGGGKAAAGQEIVKQGFNTNLPGPHLQDQKNWVKGNFYDKSDQDSAAAAERERAEETYAKKVIGDDEGQAYPRSRPDSIVKAVKEKMERVNDFLSQPSPAMAPPAPGRGYIAPPARGEADVARLEKLMGLTKGKPEENTEIKELDGVIDKLILAEHPEMARDTGGLRRMIEERKTLAVSRAATPESISVLGTDSSAVNRAGFYGLETNGGIEIGDLGLASAIVTDTRQVVKGSSIRMELLTEIRIGSVTIPQGESIYGIAGNPGSERLPVSVNSIFYNQQSFPVALEVLGSDGLPGLPIPGSFSREALRESAGQGVGAIEPGNLDPSLGAQAASAGIQVARNLASRKIRVETARVQAGVRVFLQDIKH